MFISANSADEAIVRAIKSAFFSFLLRPCDMGLCASSPQAHQTDNQPSQKQLAAETHCKGAGREQRRERKRVPTDEKGRAFVCPLILFYNYLTSFLLSLSDPRLSLSLSGKKESLRRRGLRPPGALRDGLQRPGRRRPHPQARVGGGIDGPHRCRGRRCRCR